MQTANANVTSKLNIGYFGHVFGLQSQRCTNKPTSVSIGVFFLA